MMDITTKLKPHVKEIQADVTGDDVELKKHAAAIINLHGLHVKCPGDPAAPALCEAAFDEWKAARAARA